MDDRSRSPGALRALAGVELPLGPALAAVVRRAEWVIVGLGVAFRVAQYLAGRSLWMDEGSLAANVLGRTWSELFGPLANNQLAPPGFLAVEWLAGHLGDDPRYTLRLFPLACGIASLFLLRPIARRCLRPDAVWVALALFATSDDLIYFASELKPYTTDVAAGLACTLLGLAMTSRPATPARLAGFAATGAVAVWFSYPSAFVLAAVGTTLVASALASGRWGRAAALSGACLAWAASFAAVYAVGMRQLVPRSTMWTFWNFAFPPWPPRSAWDAAWPIRRGLYLFVNPLDFTVPGLGPKLSALPALVGFLLGLVPIRRRDPRAFAMLAGPGLLALAAAYLRLYPFHGRLILFVVPSLLLFIAEGAARAAGWTGGRKARAAVLATVLLFPTLWAVYHLAEPRSRMDFNPHGDRRPARLDPSRFPL